MKHINELSSILNKTLNRHKARATCLAQIICGVIATKSTNLTQVSLAMRSKAKPESSYRRAYIESMFPLPRKLILTRVAYQLSMKWCIFLMKFLEKSAQWIANALSSSSFS